MAQMNIWTPYDGNSEERDTKSDLRNAAYAISTTAVVKSSLSTPDRKKKLDCWSTDSSDVQKHAEL